MIDPKLKTLTWKTSLLAIMDLVLPRVCVVCERELLPEEKHICFECLAGLPLTHFAKLSRNPMADAFNIKIARDCYEPYAYAAALYFYSEEDNYSRIPWALKYRGDFGVGRYFSNMLGEQMQQSALFKDIDLVVPVPLHWLRRHKRGYNQAEVIADSLGKVLDAPVITDLLVRTRRTHTQTKLGMEQKGRNVQGAFSVRGRRLKGLSVRHILLCDDVFTTGSTLSQCYFALKDALGPDVRISVATLGFVGKV